MSIKKVQKKNKKVLDFLYKLWYNFSANVDWQKYYTHSGCTGRCRFYYDSVSVSFGRDGGKTLGGKTNGSSINETVA